MMSHAQAHTDAHPAHPYHLVDPSPWPLVGGVSAFILAFGAITYFHDHGQKWALLLGLALVVVTMIGWWRDVIREARGGQAHTAEVRHGLRIGMVLFIASEVMFFFGFFRFAFHFFGKFRNVFLYLVKFLRDTFNKFIEFLFDVVGNVPAL